MKQSTLTWDNMPLEDRDFIEAIRALLCRLYDRILEETGLALSMKVYDFDLKTGEAFITAEHIARNSVIRFTASDTHFPVNATTGEYLRTYNKMMQRLTTEMHSVAASKHMDVESMMDVFEPKDSKAFYRWVTCSVQATTSFLLDYVGHPFYVADYTKDMKPIQIPNAFYIIDIVGVENNWGVDRRSFANLFDVSPHMIRRVYYRPGVNTMICETTSNQYRLYSAARGLFTYEYYMWQTVVDCFLADELSQRGELNAAVSDN